MKAERIKEQQESAYLTDGNIAYIEALYDDFLKDPNSIEDYWRSYFHKLVSSSGTDGIDTPMSDVREHFLALAKTRGARGGSVMPMAGVSRPDFTMEKQKIELNRLIDAYRAFGHHQAKLDPLELAVRKTIPDLQLNHYSFSKSDFNKTFPGCGIGTSKDTLGAIYETLQKTYCDTLGVEFSHITNKDETTWIQNKLESVKSHPQIPNEKKLRIFRNLIAAEGLEKYLGSKYVGQKRFSLEGAVSLIPMLDALGQHAGEYKANELIIGMAHRGRLNVLTNIFGKAPEKLFKEFEGKLRDDSHSGDVKYHKGFSSNIKTPGGLLHIALAFNPSHLEIIDPVVEGSVRARQDRYGDKEREKVIPVLIHGDAAFAGQGVVQETFNFSQARGFYTGGTVHIVVNNQVGFTTSNPLDSRSTLYCTDIAKVVQAPVFHVNGDDPEACVFAIQLALDFRMRFKKDVVVDLVCYRRHGHNEADEPSGTQPMMYKKIKTHTRTKDLYADQLIQDKVMTKADVDAEIARYRKMLDEGRTVVDLVPADKTNFHVGDWPIYRNQKWDQKVDTGVKLSKIKALGESFTTIPDDFNMQAQVAREYLTRRKMCDGELPINWGFAETMAYATLLTEGYGVRLCGQDSGRGTFSHRHAVLHDHEKGSVYVPLQHLEKDQKEIAIIDSVLSEEAVLAFEYGYAITEPNKLEIWEAQFGDFANGAQVVVDQFLSSGEQKWRRLCGLVMLLPHGYEGQGPEHSSARLERYLQLSAEENMQICVPSTPAQIFHLLRRQMVRAYRKPLIVMTPKSLLRHKLAVSTLDDLTKGEFQCVIPEIDADKIKPSKVRKIVLCAGKVYYDLLQQRRLNEQTDVAIIRVEQLYPFPSELLKKIITPYKKAKDIIWCQEEPRNQGGWYELKHHFENTFGDSQRVTYVGRAPSASPATGYTSLHMQQQKALVDEALS